MKLTQRSRVCERWPEGCTCVRAIRSSIPPEVRQRGMQKKARGPSASLGLAGSRELRLQTRRPPETISLSPNPASLERGDLGNNLSWSWDSLRRGGQGSARAGRTCLPGDQCLCLHLIQALRSISYLPHALKNHYFTMGRGKGAGAREG